MKKIVLTFALLAFAGTAQAADLAVPPTVSPGTPIKSVDMNDNGNGTVTDRLTGLIWLKNANCFGTKAWDKAVASAATLAHGGCGLTDNSVAGKWRLPTIVELKKMQDFTRPEQTTNHPFSGVQTNDYWSSTTFASFTTSNAWLVALFDGYVYGFDKKFTYSVWPVRGG